MLDFIQILQYGGFFASQAINSLLLYLLYMRANSCFGRYRILMVAFSIYAMAYSLIEVLTLPIMINKDYSLCVCSDGPLKLDKSIGIPLTSLYCGCFGMCISLLALHFYYRYIAVCKPENLRFFAGKRIILTMAPCFTIWATWTLTVYFFMNAPTEKQQLYHDILQDNFGINSYNASLLSFYYRTLDNGEGPGHWNFDDLFGCLILSLIMSSCFSTIIFCGTQALRHMKNCSAHMSPKTKELNRQLFVTLGVQTLLPLFTMYIPVGSIIVLPVFNWGVGLNANKTGGFLGLYPALDPLAAVFLIRDFRNFVLCKKTSGMKISSSTGFSTYGISASTHKI